MKTLIRKSLIPQLVCGGIDSWVIWIPESKTALSRFALGTYTWDRKRGRSRQSILASAACRTLGFGLGCGLVFCVAFGFSAFATVLFALVVSSHLAFLLVVLRVWWFRLSALLVRVWSFRGAAVSFHAFRGFASRVGIASRNLAKKWEVRVVSVPRISAVKRSAGRSEL